MKIDTKALVKLKATSEVVVGNIYPAKGGRKPGTDYWMVVSVSGNSCHLLGFSKDGEIVSTASYGVHAMRERPVLGRAKLDSWTIPVTI